LNYDCFYWQKATFSIHCHILIKIALPTSFFPVEVTTTLDLPAYVLADGPKNTTSKKSAEETPKRSLRPLKRKRRFPQMVRLSAFYFTPCSRKPYLIFLSSLSALEPPLKKGRKVVRSSTDPKPPVPDKRTPKSYLTLQPNLNLHQWLWVLLLPLTRSMTMIRQAVSITRL